MLKDHSSTKVYHPKNKEKILLLSSRPFENSGMTKIEVDIINNTIDSVDFDVASFDYHKEYIEILKNKVTNIYKLPDKRHILSYFYKIFKIVNQNKYHKVYIHGNSPLMVLEALPSKLAGAKVITHCHNGKPQNKLLKYYISKPLFNRVSDYKIACSEKASEWAYYGEHIVIKNGIDINRFKYNEELRKALRHELGLTENCVVGHIGSFNEQKNHKKLISIFRKIIEVKPNAKLLLIGEGELKKDIEEIVKKKGLSDKVLFMGYVNNPEDYLQAMDIMIIPSLFEGFCLVALEAQVSGLPVLASDRIPDEALVTDNCIKTLLESNDEKWVKKALSMTNEERKDNSKMLFEKGYSIEHMIESIRKILLK